MEMITDGETADLVDFFSPTEIANHVEQVIVTDGENGLLTNFFDVEQMAAKVETAPSMDRETRHTMTSAARNRILETYAAQRQAVQLEKWLIELVG